MKLKIGDKVRVIKRDGKGSTNNFNGEIIAFYYTYIVVQLENCKECFKKVKKAEREARSFEIDGMKAIFKM